MNTEISQRSFTSEKKFECYCLERNDDKLNVVQNPFRLTDEKVQDEY